jgi:hypothetical protein
VETDECDFAEQRESQIFALYIYMEDASTRWLTCGESELCEGPHLLVQCLGEFRMIKLRRQRSRAGRCRGRTLRIDTTVVETTTHHPTDSSRLADGVRVLSRVIRRCNV